ncbi:MAG: ABC transporter permease [Halobacteriales archaeon]|nr:ABC transporter permease [Halobacteriales archaeon]
MVRRVVPPAHSRWQAQAGAFARRLLRQYARSPVSLLFLVAWPAFWYLLVAHLLFEAASGGARTVATAKAAFAVSFGLFGAFTVSLTGVIGAFTADVATKRYRKFRSLPVAPSADLVGRLAGGVALATGSYAGLLAIGLLDGAAFGLRRPWSPAVVGVSLVAFVAVGIAVAIGLAVLVPRPQQATALATAVLLASFFGTGFNGVSPGLFPGPAWLLNVIPVSLIGRLHLAHLVAPAAADAAAFGPPALPTHPAALVAVVAYGVGSVALAAGVLARAAYRGEVGE